MTLCGPWLTLDTVTLCEVPADDPGRARYARALEVATWLVYMASGRQYPGVCSDAVRPCTRSVAGQRLAYGTGGSRAIGAMAGCGCSGDVLGCGCQAHPNVKLPGWPVIDATVDIGGEPFTAFTIVSDRWLVRSDGGTWPCCQNLGLEDGQPGTWTVRYRYGAAPPPPLVSAVEYLACQLAASWTGGACSLPERLTTLTYEGATVASLDPFDFLDKGRFGIPQVDYAIALANPQGLQRTAKAVTAGDLLSQMHRVRTP